VQPSIHHRHGPDGPVPPRAADQVSSLVASPRSGPQAVRGAVTAQPPARAPQAGVCQAVYPPGGTSSSGSTAGPLTEHSRSPMQPGVDSPGAGTGSPPDGRDEGSDSRGDAPGARGVSGGESGSEESDEPVDGRFGGVGYAQAKRFTVAAKVLNVPRDAGRRTVTKAYRNLAREVHPDKGGHEDDFKKVSTAFDTVTAEVARREATPPPSRGGSPPPSSRSAAHDGGPYSAPRTPESDTAGGAPGAGDTGFESPAFGHVGQRGDQETDFQLGTGGARQPRHGSEVPVLRGLLARQSQSDRGSRASNDSHLEQAEPCGWPGHNEAVQGPFASSTQDGVTKEQEMQVAGQRRTSGVAAVAALFSKRPGVEVT